MATLHHALHNHGRLRRGKKVRRYAQLRFRDADTLILNGNNNPFIFGQEANSYRPVIRVFAGIANDVINSQL
jgi:hypothetical protein